jgi:predicted kinase
MGNSKVLIITFGLTGCGKSFISKILNKKLKNSILIQSDKIRKQIFGISPYKKVIVPYGQGIYSEKISEEVYEKMIEIADDFLKNNKNVIIDASFLKLKWRKKAKELALKNNAKFFIIAPFALPQKIKERLLKRKRDISDGRWEIYLKQKENYERINEDEKKYTIFIDNNKSKKEILKEIDCFLSVLKNVI